MILNFIRFLFLCEAFNSFQDHKDAQKNENNQKVMTSVCQEVCVFYYDSKFYRGIGAEAIAGFSCEYLRHEEIMSVPESIQEIVEHGRVISIQKQENEHDLIIVDHVVKEISGIRDEVDQEENTHADA